MQAFLKCVKSLQPNVTPITSNIAQHDVAVLYCIVLHCTALYHYEQHVASVAIIILGSGSLHAVPRGSLHVTSLNDIFNNCPVLYCIVLHGIAAHHAWPLVLAKHLYWVVGHFMQVTSCHFTQWHSSSAAHVLYYIVLQ